MRRNQRVAQKIAEALARRNGPADKPAAIGATKPFERYNRALLIVERICDGEKLWSLKEIEQQTGIGYWTIYRALRGKPGFLDITNRQKRVTDSLYRSWIQSWVLGIPLDT